MKRKEKLHDQMTIGERGMLYYATGVLQADPTISGRELTRLMAKRLYKDGNLPARDIQELKDVGVETREFEAGS